MPTVNIGLRPPAVYDFEYHVGGVFGSSNPVVQAECSEKLTSALQNQKDNGAFTFNVGGVGPVSREINLRAGEVLARGGVVDGDRWGGKLSGFGTRSWQYPSGSIDVGDMTRWTRVDGENGGSILRVRGNAKVIEGIVFSGHEYVHDSSGEGPDGAFSSPAGTRVPIGIEIEGQNGPLTGGPPAGLHIIADCAIWSCEVAIFQRDGYYDSLGAFHSVGSAANGDNVAVTNLVVHDCDVVFRSDNEQAVAWDFDRLYIIFWGGSAFHPVTVFDCISCSDITSRVISLNNPAAVVVQVTDNIGQHIVCEHVRWDHGGFPEYLTLFKYADDAPLFPNMSPFRFDIEITGSLPIYAANPYPIKRLIEVPQITESPNYRFPTKDIRIKMWRLPREGFIDIGGGFCIPGPDYTADLKARWKMDEGTGTTIADVWNGRDGTLTGTLPTWTPKSLADPNYGAKLKYALSFANNSGAAVIPDHSSLRMTTGGTLSFWFLARSFANGTLVSKFGANPTGVRIEASGTHFCVTGDGANKFDVTNLSLNVWHFLALVVDTGGVMRMYLDGAVVTPSFVSQAPNGQVFFTWFNDSSGHDLRIGAPEASFYGSGANSFDGMIEDVRLHGAWLSYEETEQLRSWRPE
jgi:hypothetical protein